MPTDEKIIIDALLDIMKKYLDPNVFSIKLEPLLSQFIITASKIDQPFRYTGLSSINLLLIGGEVSIQCRMKTSAIPYICEDTFIEIPLADPECFEKTGDILQAITAGRLEEGISIMWDGMSLASVRRKK